MIQEYQIRVQPHVAANEQALRSWLADEYGFDVRTMTAVRILRRSIDARQRTIFVNLKVRCYLNEQPQQDDRPLSLKEKEAEMIRQALEKHHGNRKLAAEELGMSERTLYRKLPDEYRKK